MRIAHTTVIKVLAKTTQTRRILRHGREPLGFALLVALEELEESGVVFVVVGYPVVVFVLFWCPEVEFLVIVGCVDTEVPFGAGLLGRVDVS